MRIAPKKWRGKTLVTFDVYYTAAEAHTMLTDPRCVASALRPNLIRENDEVRLLDDVWTLTKANLFYEADEVFLAIHRLTSERAPTLEIDARPHSAHVRELPATQ